MEMPLLGLNTTIDETTRAMELHPRRAARKKTAAET